MNDDRRRILGLLADGRINAQEAERMLAAVETGAAGTASPPPSPASRRLRYLKVEVDARRDRGDGPAHINVRIPMNLLRAGVRLAAVLPTPARERFDEAMARNGIPFRVDQLRPDNIDDLIEQLGEVQVDIDDNDARVRVSCE